MLETLSFGGALQRARTSHLDALGGERLLVLGEGDGRFLEALLTSTSWECIECVESSLSMVRRARARLMAAHGRDVADRVRFCIEDARHVDYGISCRDAVICCFFLDCFEERDLYRLVTRLVAALRVGGRFLLVDFAPPGNRRARLALGFLYFCFGLLTDISARRLVDPRPQLEAAGLELVRCSEHARGLVYSALYVKRGA